MGILFLQVDSVDKVVDQNTEMYLESDDEAEECGPRHKYIAKGSEYVSPVKLANILTNFSKKKDLRSSQP